ncbi:MAG: IS256 family transposase [bacterium]
MKRVYQIAETRDRKALTDFLVREGQGLLPFVELIAEARMAVDEFIDVLGRASLEAVLQLSAGTVAGPPHQGKVGGEVRRHGSQPGVVCLSTQKVRVRKPRLRKKGGGKQAEVPIPAYEAMQSDAALGEKLSSILLRGVSTRNYEDVIPEMAETCGVSKSSMSREFIEASAEQLKALAERRFEDLDLLVIYIDGVQFGGHHVIGAVGVDTDGRKHVLGLAEGATENAVVVKGLLESLVERGVRPDRRRLFVIDGSKALRAAIDAVFGAGNPVQRCRNHKVENVTGHLPRELRDQVKTVMKAAYRLPAEEGMAKLKQQASWLEREYPSAAASLLEGLDETFTVNRLSLSVSLRRCLATTNIVESPTSGVRLRTRRVTHWQNGEMVLRWAAAALLETEKSFRRIMGHQDLWMLKAVLDEEKLSPQEVRVA